jgi:hypothetical protein
MKQNPETLNTELLEEMAEEVSSLSSEFYELIP